MNRIFIILIISLTSVGCGAENNFNIPDFDGAYIQSESKELLRLKDINERWHVWRHSKARNSRELSETNVRWRTNEESNFVSCEIKTSCMSNKIRGEHFKGLTIKGLYSFDKLSIHKVDFIDKVPKLGVFEEWKSSPYKYVGSKVGKKYGMVVGTDYSPSDTEILGAVGSEIEGVLKKRIAEDTYFFKTEDRLPSGYYVAVIDEHLWWFEIV